MAQSAPRNTKPLKKKSWQQSLTTPRNMALLAAASVILLILAGVGAVYVWQSGRIAGLTLAPPPDLTDLATEFPELASILQDQELDSVYKEFLVVYQRDGGDAALELARKRGLLNANDELRMTLVLDTEDTADLQADLNAVGIIVTAASGNQMDISIPLAVLQQAIESGQPASLFQNITDLEHIIRIRLPQTNFKDSSRLESGTEALPRIGATAWQQAGFTGKGVKVGILDVGFDGYRNLLGRELPAAVVAQSFIAGMAIDQTGEVHGTAVAEIIHDIAPDAELFFASSDTMVETQQAIDWLLSQGVRIISHSAGWVYGPKDGSSSIAQTVNRVVDGGVVWVNSAGNYADTHYRGQFTDQDGDGYHEFAQGDEMIGMEMYKSPQRVRIVLNWNDWQSANQDYDLYILDANTNILASSENAQSGPGSEPVEYIIYEFTDTGPYYLAIYAKSATRPVVFDLYAPDTTLEYYTPEYSLNTPADALRGITVGATFWSDDALETYSSQGPTDDGRLKPEISAPAGTNSESYQGPFYGTSASTPHVSGAAALVLGAYPGFTPDQVADFLKSRAFDLGRGGPDTAYGYGRLLLGDPPVQGVVPVPTQPEEPPQATATSLPTATGVKTSIPAATARPISTPQTSTSDSAGAIWGWGLLMCVFLPAMLGLGGIGLLGGVWYLSRSQARRASSSPAAAYPPPDVYPDRTPASWELPSAARQPDTDACPRCGANNRPEARFCSTCGLVLQVEGPPAPEKLFCINCGNELRQGSKFCPRCGHRSP